METKPIHITDAEFEEKVLNADLPVLDADQAMHYGVQGIPTLLVFSGGELIREHVGVVPEPHLRELVDEVLEIAMETTPS
jgi:thioredoxin-like negative regulator of GroEL